MRLELLIPDRRTQCRVQGFGCLFESKKSDQIEVLEEEFSVFSKNVVTLNSLWFFRLHALSVTGNEESNPCPLVDKLQRSVQRIFAEQMEARRPSLFPCLPGQEGSNEKLCEICLSSAVRGATVVQLFPPRRSGRPPPRPPDL
jgi:hypothetical protein